MLAKKQYTEFVESAADLKFYNSRKSKMNIVDLVMLFNMFESNRTVGNGFKVLESIKNYLISNTSPTPINRKIFNSVEMIENEMKHNEYDEEKFYLEIIKIYNDFFGRFNKLGE